jgi:HlyD family secretion protein
MVLPNPNSGAQGVALPAGAAQPAGGWLVSLLGRPALRGGALGVAALVLGGLLATRPTAVETVVVEHRELVQKVVATGRVEPPARINLGILASGIAVRVAVEEGGRVKAGQVLVELDPAEAEANLQHARAGVAAAQARLEQLKRTTSRVAAESLRQADLQVASSAQSLERLEALARSGSGSQQALDEARSALELARSRRESALAQVASTSGNGSDLLLASANLAQAQAVLAQAQVRLGQTRLVAPADGLVLSRQVEPGDVVQPGRTLLVLARDGATRLVAEPDEKSLAFVREGQRARASADAFAGQSFESRVLSIAPAIDPRRGTVQLKLEVPEPPVYLRADMTVSIDIEVARAAGALVIPSEVVRDASSAAPWVLLVRDGKAVRQQVALGLRGEGRVQVLEGLAAGDRVVRQEGTAIKPGQRVRAG